jgi:hypothetical protein
MSPERRRRLPDEEQPEVAIGKGAGGKPKTASRVITRLGTGPTRRSWL